MWLDMLGCSVRHYDAGGVSTRVIEAGAGEPVVLLHGLSGHAESWARNIVPLAERFRVVAVDMIGHGLTDKPDRSYLLPTFVEHLGAVLRAVSVGEAHLVGQSLGGWVAAWLALEQPEAVRTLTLVTTAGLKVSLATDGVQQLQSQVRAVTRKALDALTRDAVRARLEWLMHRPQTVTDELVELRYRIFLRDDSRRTMSRMVDDVTGDANLEYALTEDRLRQLEIPTLVLWSRHNPTTPWEEGEAAAAVIPKGRFVLLEDCAHWPQFEEPERFNDVVLAFLSEHQTVTFD
ncbi:MAG: alpha/beta fold hydrolase [Actinomycetota bacterium]|jgi:2-hydroxy-6-oxonona-2,4-dienedioate hydrolase